MSKLCAICCFAALTACGGGGSSETMALPQGEALSVQAALGEKIFNDASLSASGAQSCATCHVPEHKHSPANDFPAQFGGPLGNLQGTRSTPSIRYLLLGTPFFFDTDGTPTGGFFWDGRARNLAEQATEPFLNPFEMANDDKASVVRRLAAAPYSDEFRNVFGEAIFSDVDGAFMRMSLAVQQYEREERSFNSFSSKYDAFLRGATELNDQEMHGLALFNSPVKGNCAACHPSDRGSDGSMPLFTDSTYDNLGVPRNPELSRNADPQYFDLGLCQVPALASHEELCGAFKVPSLRNVAVREVYFHNGYFKSLKDVVTFYVQRDTNPEKWYPLNADGSVHKFDDLPPQYHSNVNAEEVPYNRQPGDAPALSESEIDDVLAFLRTLTDGYSP